VSLDKKTSYHTEPGWKGRVAVVDSCDQSCFDHTRVEVLHLKLELVGTKTRNYSERTAEVLNLCDHRASQLEPHESIIRMEENRKF